MYFLQERLSHSLNKSSHNEKNLRISEIDQNKKQRRWCSCNINVDTYFSVQKRVSTEVKLLQTI